MLRNQISKNKKKFLFAGWKVSFRNPKSFHVFHKHEGITEKMIIDSLMKATQMKPDPRKKLRKKIRFYHITEHLTKHLRLTIIFQLFPKEKRLHVINAFLGSFHYKNLYEKIGLKAKVPKRVEKKFEEKG